jgi:hypothetical protein
MCVVIEVVSFYLSVAKYTLILITVVAASSAVSHSHTPALLCGMILLCLYSSFSFLFHG